MIRRLPSKSSRKRKQPAKSVFTTEGDNLDLVASSENEDNATLVKRKRGRPRKDLAILSPETPSPGKMSRNSKKSTSPALSDNLEVQERKSSSRKKKSASPVKRSKSSKEKQEQCSSSTSKPRKYRKRLEVLSPTVRRLPSKGNRKRKRLANSVTTIEDENLDLVANSEFENNATSVKRKRGRPRKDLAILSPETPSPGKMSRNPTKSTSPALSDNLEVQETKSSSRKKKSASPVKRSKSSKEKEKQELCSNPTSKPRKSRKRLEVLSPTVRQLPSKGSRKRKQLANSVTTTEGENLDLAASSETEDNAISVKRKRGRPRKDLAILSPGASSSVSSRRPDKASRNAKKSASPAKLKLSSKRKCNRSPAPPTKARI